MVGSWKQSCVYLVYAYLSLLITIYIIVTGKWIEFDDDNPKPRLQDDITRLSGGGENLLN
jgi:hypothetical protein